MEIFPELRIYRPYVSSQDSHLLAILTVMPDFCCRTITLIAGRKHPQNFTSQHRHALRPYQKIQHKWGLKLRFRSPVLS